MWGGWLFFEYGTKPLDSIKCSEFLNWFPDKDCDPCSWLISLSQITKGKTVSSSISKAFTVQGNTAVTRLTKILYSVHKHFGPLY
jgi:hypothetical protein